MSGMPDESTTDLAEGLSRLLGSARIVDLRRLSGGASRETWSFVADGERLILQRARRGAQGGLRGEPSVLVAARKAGVRVPEMIVDGSLRLELGRPFMIVRHVDGETIARRILRDAEFAAARRVLVGQLARSAAHIHRIAVDDVPELAREDQLDVFARILHDSGQSHPVLEAAIRWLAAHRPERTRTCVVHGDFRLGNVVVDGDGLAAVLDWELAHVGDPVEDLGWLCVRSWRFGGELPVAGLGEREELCAAYEAESGVRTEIDHVRWWEVMGVLRWGVICIMQAQTHLRGIVRSHELAAIGRRVCETEYDLLDALDEVMA